MSNMSNMSIVRIVWLPQQYLHAWIKCMRLTHSGCTKLHLQHSSFSSPLLSSRLSFSPASSPLPSGYSLVVFILPTSPLFLRHTFAPTADPQPPDRISLAFDRLPLKPLLSVQPSLCFTRRDDGFWTDSTGGISTVEWYVWSPFVCVVVLVTVASSQRQTQYGYDNMQNWLTLPSLSASPAFTTRYHLHYRTGSGHATRCQIQLLLCGEAG